MHPCTLDVLPLPDHRVLVKGQEGSDGVISHHLVRIDKPVLRIPMLAIHLQVTSCLTA
jgi:aspartyl aminopeptidase